MISSRSRYAHNGTELATSPDGTVRKVISPSSQKTVRARARRYRWKEGDRVDLLADRWYGDPTQWWRIADVNPHVLDWTEPDSGTVIRIPNVS
ncbi:tail protein X [Streptomyces sp. UNOC14_S4]|uniref:tail protein X n=1 Tax=Streptomyces sp. UNOC14_S4 TaxID=2872340 RepID=UPI001E3703C0|nr:tail protein X [Streptomyces sp. UNOC14_S4]MCC3766037.1 tail protein X [Streptomyces sp. UNOC14_S4]